MEKQLYGISSKFDFGKWQHGIVKLSTKEQAKKWLDTETYDFREREILNKTQAIKLVGRKQVENCNQWEN